MTDLLPLNLFPVGALSGSVITTVWVGVFVVVFFNLRLGWVLSGLVVPGYLVPLLLLKPSAALVVAGEGILTYFLVWFYSEWLSQRCGWNNFFGRDRFFALVLTSVAVRIVCDGWLLPALGEYLVGTWEIQFDYRNNLHSFGLIIVALIANNFWKTGLRRGLLPMAATVGITYLIVRYGLMELTNFSVSNIGYLYEDMAASILASPKAYIILLTTAFVASRMNLFYGWDFSGILIPSLLALQWYQPEKIAMSFIEALVILLMAHAVLRTPLLRRTTVEGGRKILLFFNLGFLYKFTLAYLLLALNPEAKVTDYYGFGYLLPTLIAMKMHDKDIFARMSRAILQTSIAATLVATLVGFGLSLLPDPWRWLVADAGTGIPAKPSIGDGSLVEQLREDKVQLYRTRTRGSVAGMTAVEEETFNAALRLLAAGDEDPAGLERIAGLLDGANYRLEIKESRYQVLREKEPRKYWGTYVVNPHARNDLLIEVPAPIDERGAMEAAVWLFRSLDARALAIAGSARRANKDGSSDVLANPNLPFNYFHRQFSRRNVLQVRAYTGESARLAGAGRTGEAAEQPPSRVAVKGELPEALSLTRLKELIDHFDLSWQTLPLPNMQRESTSSGFVELFLNRDDLRKIVARSLASEQAPRLEALDRSIEGYLQDWLLTDRERIAPAGSNLYRVAHLEDLIYFDDEIVSPLLRTAKNHYIDGAWTAAGLEDLKLINVAAGLLGYEIIRYRQKPTGADYLILAETPNASPKRYWGTYIFRLGAAQPYAFQAPRPLFEVNSFEFAVSLFERLRGQVLLIGGAHPGANQDHSADITKLANKVNLFNLVSQALTREAGEQPLLFVQVRALGNRPGSALPAADVLLSYAGGLNDPARGSLLDRSFVAALQRFGHSVQFADGRPEEAGYDAGGSTQSLYVETTPNKDFAIAWVSPLARGEYRQQSGPNPQATQFAALRIASRDEDIARWLAATPRTPGLPGELRSLVDGYLERQDIVLLDEARRRFPDLRLVRLVDRNSRRPYLAVLDRHGNWLGIANLGVRPVRQALELPPRRGEAPEILAFLEGSAPWLTVAGAPRQ